MAKRPSPDSVICIDLTESDDEREKNLSDVRKRLKGTPAASTAATVKMEGAARAKGSNNDDDDDDGGGKIGSCAALQQQEWASEVEVIEPVAPEIHAASSSTQSANDDEVMLVGTANESRLPHMRQHCPDNKFVQDVVSLNSLSGYARLMTVEKRRQLQEGKTGNVSFCDLCFCFVCDKPASECTSWGTAAHVSYSSHCHASDSGNDARMWKNRRNTVKNAAKTGTRVPSYIQPAASGSGAGTGNQGGPQGSSPFAPDNAIAAQSRTLTQCRKCGWFTRFSHNNFSFVPRYGWKHAHNPMGSDDWCHACGRIASERDFGKVQSEPYTRTPGDVFLGEKTIPFRIVAHDPRQMEKYQDRYTEHGGTDPKWNYSEADEESDFFRHRFGKYPQIEVILGSIPVVAVDKIGKNETFKVHYTNDFEKNGTDDPGYNPADYDADGYRTEDFTGPVTPDEMEAIILENPGDKSLLEELNAFGTIAAKKRDPQRDTHITPYVSGDIVAKWNRQGRNGTFTIRIFLQSRVFTSADPSYRASLSRFLGAWFNIFPFSLSDLSGLIPAEELERPERQEWESSLPHLRRAAAFDRISAEMESEVQKHNDAAKAKQDQLSLNSSTKCDVMGGACSSATGLAGVLRRYFTETFADDVLASSSYGSDAWRARGRGQISSHRDTRLSVGTLDPRKTSYGARLKKAKNLRAYLTDVEQVFAISNLRSGCDELQNKMRSLKGVMEHLENLHHAPIPFVEGLNIELLEFQRQSVQWALERETTPGGVQSFLWAKLPSVAEAAGQDLYYSPILERFRRDKPQLVRGGIIAEEMGLGKTVISLALILQNPAPAVPQSGSPISALDALSNNTDVASAAAARTPWDTGLYSRTATSNSKRGSILSRGTLVVCHVSLVGQWIDEAKEKLSDPGLVYPYHGQSRKRNAATLAQNAIVVTTYQTLASDATYHAKKGGSDYCAPCEQVRWWRIICDESHSLREGGTKKSLAVMNLVADHKWLVSGTPINTSFKDLKNQLKFIGLDNVEEMFGVFNQTAMKHANDPSSSKKRGRRAYCRDERVTGHFMFLLRCIMIRHTHEQTYRGTTTTLMSLPPKVERTVEVEFSDEEKEEYVALDKAARDFYAKFKEEHGHTLSKHYLLLTQKLTPLRIAASGGRIPLEDEEEEKSEEADEEAADDSDDESYAPKKKKAKKEKRFSEFAYKSKLNALVRELEQARDEDCNAKSLVFSQFTSTLEWLQRELPKHGFQYRTLSGDMSMKKRAKALHDFQHDPPTTIFLLSMRAGAVGINLTQANRVFLMEPSFNPALEAQAIGRVHRLGQKRNVEIVRFVMKDSVEPRILEMLKKKYADADPTKPHVEEVVERGRGRKGKKYVEPALVGCIHNDRTAVLGAEFDILFGVSTSDASSGTDAKPEAVASSASL